MKVYISTMIISLLILIISKKVIKTKNNKIGLILSAIPLIITAGFRYGVGQDYFSYAKVFELAKEEFFFERIEPGFYFIIKVILIFSKDYIWLFVITSIIYIAFVYMAIREQSDNNILSIYLFITIGYYFTFFNGMRQMLAVSIFFYSIKYIKNRKLLPYIICIIAATLIHYSAILYFPLYFIYGKKLKNSKFIAVLIISIVFETLIAKLILSIVSISRYSNYIGGAFDTGEKSYIQILMNIIILLFALFYNRKELEIDADYSFYCILQLIYTIITIYIGDVPLISRIRWGVGLPLIILIPKIIKREKNRKTRFLYYIVIVSLYFAYFYYTIGINNYNNVLPFNWIILGGV